jgi:hypothetical protein
MAQDQDPLLTALANALAFLTSYVDEREVPDEIADDDVNALETVVTYLLDVPEALRPQLVALVGHQMAAMCGLIEEPQE